MGGFEKNFLQALVGRKKLHAAQMTYKKILALLQARKTMSQSYFIGALQNPSKTATIQWLIFYETPFLHQDLFRVFFPWMVCHHKRHNFAFSLSGLFFARRLQSGKGDLC